MAFGDFTVDRIGAKYVLGSGGSYVSYATDEPAFEFNSDGSYKGLLVEPASTNQVRNGSATGSTLGLIGSGGALPTNWFVVDNAAALAVEIIGTGTESGVSYIDLKLSGTAASSNPTRISFEASTQIVAAPSEVWTSSFFAKTIDLTAAYNSVYVQQTYRTAAGVFVNGDVNLITLTSSLARYSETGTAPATTERVVPEIGFGVTNGQAYDFTVRVGWAQIEKSPIATSPIPTSGSTVTRNKDDINLTSASSLIGQTEGTLYVEVDWRDATGVNQEIINISDGTSNNRILIFNATNTELRMFAEADDDIKINQGVSSSGFSGIQKIAFAYADADFELYRNGSSVFSDTVGSLSALATLTDIDLGQDINSNTQANMWIRAAALFTRRLSDAECIALTTL